MPVAWFVAPYKRRDVTHGTFVRRRRYCSIDDYTSLIEADGGTWAETEVLGQRAIVKVRASVATLQTINADPDIRGLPAVKLDDSLSALTAAQRAALRQLALDCGYNAGEWAAAFPLIGQATLGQVLRFLATRRRKVRYDVASDAIVADGPVVTPMPVDKIDADVTDTARGR